MVYDSLLILILKCFLKKKCAFIYFSEVKRKRKDSDNDAEKNALKKAKNSSPTEHVSSDNESQEPDAQTIEERIDFLSDAFTAFSREVNIIFTAINFITT